METLAHCLKVSGVWSEGSAVVAMRDVIANAPIPLIIRPWLRAFGIDKIYIVETPIGDPVFAKKDGFHRLETQNSSHPSAPPLTFVRTLEPPSGACASTICTADKYIVDARRFRVSGVENTNENLADMDKFVESLTQAAHRKSIRRFTAAFRKAGASMYLLKAHEAMAWVDRLYPLHMEVQRRNGGSKDRPYLVALLEACRDRPAEFSCVVAQAKDGTPMAFGIYVLERHTRFTAVDDGDVHASLFLALVGNSRERGGKVSAYHNMLFEGVRMATASNAVMDLGLSHWSVKKVFEPQRVPQYLTYAGHNILVDLAFRSTNFLQYAKLLRNPLQPE